MDLAHQPTKILITGASGTGKSTYWTRCLLGFPARYKFVYDHEGELAARLGVPSLAGLPELAESTARGWAIFDPHRLFPGRIEEGFAFFCDFAFAAGQRLAGRKLFACDELQCLVDTQSLSDELRLILQTGRRYQIDFLGIAQQPNEIHNRVRAQFTEVVSFLQTEALAIDWLARFGFDGEALRHLAPGEFVARTRRGTEARGRVF